MVVDVYLIVATNEEMCFIQLRETMDTFVIEVTLSSSAFGLVVICARRDIVIICVQ